MYTWAFCHGVVQAFLNAHPKSAKWVNRAYHIHPGDLEALMMHDPQRWRGYKALVKLAEKQGPLIYEWWKRGPADRHKYYTFVKAFKETARRRRFPDSIDLLDPELTV
jgi:hypothetical protein